MKLLVLNPDFYKNALLIDNKRRCFNNCIVAQKMLSIFDKQIENNFSSVPNYKVWRDNKDALKLYFNCTLKVCKEIHNINTKYNYFQDIDEKSITFPDFTDLTFKSHQAFCINLDYNLYKSKFPESENFNGSILIWEYNIIDKDNNKKKIVEDLNGIYKEEKLSENFNTICKKYDLKEINKNNFQIK